MEAKKIDSGTFLLCLGVVALCEAALNWAGPFGPGLRLPALGVARCLETCLVLLVVHYAGKGVGPSFGLGPKDAARGVFRGCIWCLGFAAAAGCGMAILWLKGHNPVLFFSRLVPDDYWGIVSYIAVGGVIGPVAEEVFFRGVIYGFLRRWGAVFAAAASTVIFCLVHMKGAGLPVTQAVGGLVFAVSYEREKSLIAPVMIHSSGNIALFALGFIANGM